LYNATKNTSDYMVYNHPYEETYYTILNHLYSYLQSFLEHNDTKEIYIFSDTHSTQRSNLIFAFFDYLVRILKVVGEEGFVELVYT
jgi:hypothetical protein